MRSPATGSARAGNRCARQLRCGPHLGGRGATVRAVPGGLWAAPYDEARQLDHWWVGGDHVLLALLASPSLASETLDELGITYAMVAQRARGLHTDATDRKEGLSPTPGTYALMGRADAFAAVDGAHQPKPEHWLLALVWDDSGIAVSLLHNTGASQVAIIVGVSASPTLALRSIGPGAGTTESRSRKKNCNR